MYKTINIKPATHKELRLIAAEAGLTIMQVIENFVKNWKSSENNEKK